MNFNFNQGFRPMGFPGMPQMHFPGGANMTPQAPQMPQAPAPQPQTNPALPQQPAFANFRDARHDWWSHKPQFGAGPPAMSGMMDWFGQRPQRSDYGQQGFNLGNMHQQFPFLQQGLLPNFGGQNGQ